MKSIIFPGLILAITLAAASAATPPFRPVAGKGAESKTLLLYSGTRTAYSLGDALEGVTLQMRRVATQIESLPVAEASSNKIESADYVVIFCPQPAPELSTNFLLTVAAAKKPVLWIGFGADQLDVLPSFVGGFEASPAPADRAATEVSYRGRKWKAPVFPWITISLISTVEAKVLMTLEDAGKQPLCWQINNFSFFAAVPSGEIIGHLFSDFLLDFFQVKDLPENCVFLRIDDYSAQDNHRDFLRIVDYLYGRGIPFMVSFVPVSKNPDTGQIVGLGSAPEFASALRYAQQRGGRLVMRGCTATPKNGEGSEFWDVEQDHPPTEDNPAAYREWLQSGLRQVWKHGIYPLAWQTPAYAASRKAYAEVGRIFSTGVERPQLSDSTHQEKGMVSSLTLDRHGRLIVPENLGYVLACETNCYAQISDAADMLLSLRGTIGGCYIHAYQPLQKVIGLVQLLESYHKPFLDLADLDNSVAMPEKALLTGNGTRSMNLSNVSIRRKNFDRSWKFLTEEKPAETLNGKQLLERKGPGEFQWLEFIEGKAGS